MTDAEIIAIVQNYLASLATVRIPELAPYSNTNDPLSLQDKIAIWRADTNKTVRTALEDLKTFLVDPSGTTLTPDKIGSSIVVIAGPDQVGTDTFNIPSLAGKQFLLRKVGFGTLKFSDDTPSNPGPKQYEILSSGGFKLLQGAIIQDNDQFELQLIDSTTLTITGSSGKLFSGAVIVSSNVTLNATNHLGKLIQLRSTAPGQVVTFPSIDDVEENTFVWVEAMINCPHEVKMATTGGQYFYFNGTSSLDILIRLGEWACLYRGTDGWYVIAAAPGITSVGIIQDGYDVGINELPLDGSIDTISITAYPRFAKWILALPNSVVDEDTRLMAQVYEKDGTFYTSVPAAPYNTILKPFRGCFGHNDGSDTIILPDFTDMFTRSLGTIATERYHNHPGGYQKDEMLQREITLPLRKSNNNYGFGVLNGPIIDVSDLSLNEKITLSGGTETRGQNIGLIKKIKV